MTEETQATPGKGYAKEHPYTGNGGAAKGKTRSKRPWPPRGAPDWLGSLRLNTRNEPYAHIANAIMALRLAPEFAGVLGFNEFSLTATAMKPSPWVTGINNFEPRPWTSIDDFQTAEWMQLNGLNVTPETASQAVQVVADSFPFHPVRDYLGALVWDGKPRLEKWLTTYLGVEETGLTRYIGPLSLLGAVARIWRPGCQCDNVLILEGKQGTKKSSALRILGDPWFIDYLPSDFGSKDAAIQTQGVWIIEISELDSTKRQDLSKVKAFLTRRSDHFRPPYGKRSIDSPRQCAFFGSTNKDQYLTDHTGNRRHWPVATGKIEYDELAEDRDQLWAETQACYVKDPNWWKGASPEVEAEVAEEQDDRRVNDPWESVIINYLEPHPMEDEKGGVVISPLVTDTSIETLLNDVITPDKTRWTQEAQNRIADILKGLGYKKYRPAESWSPGRRPRYRLEAPEK